MPEHHPPVLELCTLEKKIVVCIQQNEVLNSCATAYGKSPEGMERDQVWTTD